MEPGKREHRDWSDLPADLVRKCAGLLSCDVDRTSMVLQCRAWHEAIRVLPRRQQLPWMLVPRRRTCNLNLLMVAQAHFFCLLSARAHKMPLPHFAIGARFIGATEGGWVLLALGQNNAYCLVSFRTGTQITIPDSVYTGPAGPEPILLRASAFSCSPSDARSCVVGSIVSTFERPFLSRTLVCFSRIGAHAHSSSFEMDVEDIIYFRGSFFCLTRVEDVLRCTPEFNKFSPPDSLVVRISYLDFESHEHATGLYLNGRYLVQSRGELLMVVRYTGVSSDTTSLFALFRASPDLNEGENHVWEKLPGPDGRMIFTGRGCSRSYESSDFQQGHEGLYFFDDETFNQPAMVAFGVNGRKYRCHDNGWWPGPGRDMKRWYDWRVPYIYTPPMWFLP